MKLVNQQVIKNNNLKTLYRCIHQQPGISRAQLAKQTGLSKTTVSSLVDELIEREFIYDSGILDGTSAVGRKPNCLQLLSGCQYVAVISWEDKEICVRLIDICGIIVQEKHCPLERPDIYVPVSRKMVDEFILLHCPKDKLLGVCVVVPAMIDLDRNEIFATTMNLKSSTGCSLLDELAAAFQDVPLAIFNDTACASYAEKIYTRITEQDFAYINFSHGIGATLFIRDKMLGRASASYTQFGHYSIDPDGRQCSCGNKGCLELMIGEGSLKERLTAAGGSPSLSQNPQVTYAGLGTAGIYGDPAALKVIRDIAHDFSLALSNLVCMVHPKLVIIGGKGKDLGPLFLEEVLSNLKATGFRRMLDSIRIRYSFLDSTAAYIGAMKYFFDIHYDFTQELTGTFFIG